MQFWKRIAEKIRIVSRKNMGEIVFVLSAIAFFAIVSKFTVLNPEQGNQYNNKVVNYNENWKWIKEGNATELEYLPKKLPAVIGETVRIENTLPTNITDDMTLTLHSSRQKVKVWVEETCIYEYNGYDHPLSKSPPSKVLFLSLQKNYSGKKIAIELVSYGYTYSGRINEIFYGTAIDCIGMSHRLQIHSLLLYGTLFIMGLLLLIIFIFIQKTDMKYLTILLQGLFMQSFSLYAICENNILQMLFEENYWIDLLSYCAVLVLPLPFLIYFYAILQNQILKRIVLGSGAGLILLGALCIILHTNGLVDISTSILFYVLLYVIIMGFCILIAIAEILTKNNPYILTMYFAMGVLFLTVIIDISSRYYYILGYYNTGVILGAGVISYLMIIAGVTINRTVGAIEEVDDVKNKLVESRVELMISQIQPHFIFNTLNSIQTLIDLDSQKAIEMIDHFSKYLRAHIDTLGMEKKILFREELQNIKEYTNIEIVRFPRLCVKYEIEEDMFFVAALSIQPLVENAIKHGISKKPGGGTVRIISYLENGWYTIKIIDNGAGFDGKDSNPHHYSVGMKNITYRLTHTMNATVHWTSELNKGTEVTVKIPKEEMEDESNFSG